MTKRPGRALQRDRGLAAAIQRLEHEVKFLLACQDARSRALVDLLVERGVVVRAELDARTSAHLRDMAGGQ